MDLHKTIFIGILCQVYWVLLLCLIEAIQYKNHNTLGVKVEDTSKIHSERILSGYPSSEGEYPWMAAIFVFSKYSCSGALITERHILSAGHCFKLNNGYAIGTYQVKVALGILQLRSVKTTPILRRISNIYLNPSLIYDTTNGIVTPLNDIAVIQLETNVIFTPNIRPLKLPQAGVNYTNYTAVLAGWGATHKASIIPSNKLLYTTVKIIDYETCLQTPLKKHFSKLLHLDRILCAFGGENDGCRGDSGAPLIVRKSNYIMEVAGIMSWGVGCGDRRFPAVYTNIAYFLKWIYNVIDRIPE